MLENAGTLTESIANLHFGTSYSFSDVGILSNLAGATFTASGDGDFIYNSGNGNAINNAGTLVHTGTGDTIVGNGIAFNNNGRITIQSGSFRTTGSSSVRFDGAGYLSSQPASSLTLTGDILGNTNLSDLYTAARHTGHSPAAPPGARQFEVMSRDLGMVPPATTETSATVRCN